MNSFENLDDSQSSKLNHEPLINNYNYLPAERHISQMDSAKKTSTEALQNENLNLFISTDENCVVMNKNNEETHRAIVFRLDSSNNWIQVGIGICSYSEV